jgi:hypothetical protein
MEFSMGIDPAAAQLRHEIEQASGALVTMLKADPERPWSPRDLKAESKEGWSYGAANLALMRLVDDGTLVIDGGKVRLATAVA